MVELTVLREGQKTLPETSVSVGLGEALRVSGLWYPKIPDEAKCIHVGGSDLIVQQLQEFRPLV